jgi:hypothetical protein
MSSELERFVRDVESITTEWLADTYGLRSAEDTETLFRLAFIAARLPPSVSCHQNRDRIVIYRDEIDDIPGGIAVTMLSSLAWQTAVVVPGDEILKIKWTDVPEMISYIEKVVLVTPEVEELRNVIGDAVPIVEAHVLTGCIVRISETLVVIVSTTMGVYITNMKEAGSPARGDVVHADLGALVAFVTGFVSPVPPPMSKSAKTRARKNKRDTAPSHSVEQHHTLCRTTSHTL